MAKTLYRLVNTGLAGEEEHIALQEVDGFPIIQFYDIDKIILPGVGIREYQSEDEPLLFQKTGHQFYIHFIDNEIIIEL